MKAPVIYLKVGMMVTTQDTERLVTEVWQYPNPESLYEETGTSTSNLLGYFDLVIENGDFVETTIIDPAHNWIDGRIPTLIHDRVSIESIPVLVCGDGTFWVDSEDVALLL